MFDAIHKNIMQNTIDISSMFEQKDSKTAALDVIQNISMLALFIIGCVGAAGAFQAATIGWIAMGIAGGVFGLELIKGKFKERKFELISMALYTVALVAIGALGGTGIMAAAHVGGGIIGVSLAKLIVTGINLNYEKIKKEKQLTASKTTTYI